MTAPQSMQRAFQGEKKANPFSLKRNVVRMPLDSKAGTSRPMLSYFYLGLRQKPLGNLRVLYTVEAITWWLTGEQARAELQIERVQRFCEDPEFP